MKILHVYKDFDPPVHGGMERHIALMCRYQRQWAHVEALMCSRSLRSRDELRDGTVVHETGEWFRFQSAPFAPTFPLKLRRYAADVVVIHVPNPTAELSYLLARPSGKLIVRYHSDVVRQAAALKFYRPFLTAFLNRADVVVPTSEIYAATSPILANVRTPREVISLGIAVEEFEAPDPALIAELKAEYGETFVLFSGRHRYYKGLEYLVRAAPQIHAPVVIAGDGPETKSLRSLAQSVGADVAFPGRLGNDELVAHLHACAVFAFPSVERSEAFGISIMEAHACGKPVVATTIGTGVEFVNVHGQTGFNAPPRDPEALAAAVNDLLDDENARRRMGEFARNRIRTEFTAESVARREFDLYSSVLDGSFRART